MITCEFVLIPPIERVLHAEEIGLDKLRLGC